MKPVKITITIFGMMICNVCVFAQTQIQGAGSSAAAPIYKSWATEYQKKSDTLISYDPVGSTVGLKKIGSGQVDFGASDVVPAQADLLKQGLIVFPIAITGIAPVVNLPRITDGQMKLTGPVLAQIFSGEIVRWNSAQIAKLNPDIPLPNLAINVIVRADGSGTTYNFTEYLSKVSPTWKTTFGTGSTMAWPSGFTSVKGSAEVVKTVKETVGAIGYIDFDYVKGGKFFTVNLVNADGESVSPGPDSFKGALLNSDWASTGKFTAPLTDLKGKKTWPITMGTFVVMSQVTDKPEKTLRTLKFFTWAFMNGDHLVQMNSFVRLPDNVQASAFRLISTIKDKSGVAIGKNLFGD